MIGDFPGWSVAHIVDHPDDAHRMGLEIDHDDSHAAIGLKDFALLVHGIQTRDRGQRAKKRMRAEGIEFAYRG